MNINELANELLKPISNHPSSNTPTILRAASNMLLQLQAEIEALRSNSESMAQTNNAISKKLLELQSENSNLKTEANRYKMAWNMAENEVDRLLQLSDRELVAKNVGGSITWLVDNWPKDCLLYTNTSKEGDATT